MRAAWRGGWWIVLMVGCGTPDGGETGPDATDSADDTGTDDTGTDDTGDSGDTGPTEPVLDCEVELAPAPEGQTCTQVAAGTAGLLVRGDLLTPEGALLGGSVLVDAAGTLACVGCDCSADPAYAAATQVDCAEGVVSPGLINAHDHVTFTEGPPFAASEQRFDHRHQWRRTLEASSNSDPTNGVRLNELRMVLSGVTSTIGSGGAAGLVRNLDRSTLLEGLSFSAATFETFPLDDSDGDFEADCAWDYDGLEAFVATLPAYLPHVAEGVDTYANEEFRCLSDGSVGEDVTEANTAHMQGIGLHTLDYAVMAHDGTALVWSPRSNVRLYGQTARVALFHRLGGTVALGTDWIFSGSMNLGRELACAAELDDTYFGDSFSDADLWRMATEGGAVAAGAEGVLGSLTPGLAADLTVFAGKEHPLWSGVVQAGTTDVALVLRGGVPLYGEAELMAALAPSCEALEVCGEARALCATAQVGASLGQVLDALPDAVPAFVCDGPPADEPTCAPSRPGEYDGPTADDADGDGLLDEVDLCPTHFDPLRPIDDGVQPDLDGDGVGDACDPDPLPADVDGDGVDGDADVCPWVADDQADADHDGKGDACDACPTTANADRGCP